MKKIRTLLIIGIFIISGIISAGISIEEEDYIIENKNINFSTKPLQFMKDGYINIDFSGTNNFLNEPGKPHLPIYQTVFEFTRDAKIYDVAIEHSKPIKESVIGKIIPTSEPYIMQNQNLLESLDRLCDEDVYQSDDLYPNTWFDYSIKCGLNNNGEDTTFVIVDIYPVRYQPLIDKIHYIKDANIKITLNEEDKEISQQTIDSYDLLIIAPETFVDSIQPLITHKESVGIKTTLKTVEDILSEYSGRDQPEQIKYFIKDAKDDWDITYVLLFGGLKSFIFAKDKDDRNHGSTNGWHVPVRYTNIRNGNEVGVISDLYYSDLFRYNEGTQEWEFEDWDSNGDGIFANSAFTDRDDLDLIPDLFVGRLACRTKFEVNIIVDKIIQYESTSANEKSWYKRMIGIAGRTFNLFNGMDQSQQNDSGCIDISGVEWQEFEPRDDIISRIELKISSSETASSNLQINIEKPLGNIVASLEILPNEIPYNDCDWVSIDFQDIDVDPGEKYYIVLSSEGTDQFSWSYSEQLLPGFSRYIRGNSSLGSDLDWCFKTFDLEEGVEEPDGEYSVDAAFKYMEKIIEEEIRIYWSNEGSGDPIPETQDIIDAFNQGAGFINMEGHGNPLSWATHPIPDNAPFTGGISLFDFNELKNGDKLPIVIVGGCHNALFNVSLIKTIIGKQHDNWYWTSGYVTPICFCWALCASPIGGAIATTGCTGLGLGGTQPDLDKSGGLDCNFFYKVGDGASNLGEAHSGAIQKYVLENDLSVDEIFCIVEFHLFGDPSLRLGGYP